MNHTVHPIALFRLSVLGPLASRECLTHGELKKIVRELANQTYQIPNSKRVYIGAKSIERWYYAWRKKGIDGLAPTTRSDKGRSQLSQDIQQAIITCKQENQARSLNTIIRLLEMQGTVSKGQLVRSSVHRLLHRHGLSKRHVSSSETIERRAFEAPFAGDIWYGDVMHGPRIQTANGMKKVYLVTVMDDASRLICHSEFCLDETALSIEYVLKEALLKRGLPKRFVVDNGAAYRSETLQSICARLNIRLIYCKPYEPEGKGKLERFHRTFRAQFLTEIDVNTIESLNGLNARLWIWLERIYHQTPHSSLGKAITPLSRWQKDLLKITPLGNKAPKLDDYFYHRLKRLVRKDGTLRWENKLFEVSFELVGRHIYLVIDPHTIQAKWVESLEFDYLGPVHPLDKQANNQRKRARPNQTMPPKKSATKTNLVETAYQQASQQFDVTLLNNSKELE